MECKILIGGEAGQGIQTISNILSKYFFRIGYYVFTIESYQSRIRGGHNYSLLRISDKPIYAIDNEKVDILIALNLETIRLHLNEVKEGGHIFGDESIKTEEFLGDDRIIKIPVKQITQELRSKLVENTIFVGALLALSSGDIDEMLNISLVMKDTSFCPLGQSVYLPVSSAIKYFRDEFISHFKDKYCVSGRCKPKLSLVGEA